MAQQAEMADRVGTGRKRRGSGRTRSRQPLIDTAVHTIRAQGYAGMSIDALCRAAGVSKGAFLDHFDCKEALAIAAADSFSDMAEALFGAAPYRKLDDPLDRLLAYVDFRKAILQGDLPEFTCLLGNHPRIRAVCERRISAHAAGVEADVAAAMQARGIVADWTAVVLAKAKGGPKIAADCVDHLVAMLFKDFASIPGTGGSA